MTPTAESVGAEARQCCARRVLLEWCGYRTRAGNREHALEVAAHRAGEDPPGGAAEPPAHELWVERGVFKEGFPAVRTFRHVFLDFLLDVPPELPRAPRGETPKAKVSQTRH